MKKNIIIYLIASFLFLIFTTESRAIPAFARKYKMSCQTCHSPVPRLKAYGDDFAGNGFTLSDKDASRFFLETGDESLSLLREFPIALRLEGHISYNNGDSKQGDFGTPYLLKLMSGSEIAPGIAYYFYFYLSEQGKLAGVEDAFLMFNNMFGSDLDLYAGQFQVSDPLFKRELRLTLEDYKVYSVKPGLTKANLAYDRGLMLSYGFPTGTDIFFEVLNGSGLEGADASKLFDTDKYKNFMGRISQKIGDIIKIGILGYSGKEEQINETDNKLVNNILIFGPDISVSFGNILTFNLQYVQRKDDKIFLNAQSTASTNNIETKGAFAEIVVTPEGDDSKFYGVGMFNWVESDLAELNYKSATAHIGYMLRRNIRLVCECTYNFTSPKKEYARFSIGFVSAF